MIQTSLIGQVTFSLMLFVGIALVWSGHITLGTMTSATNLIGFVIQPCQRVTQAYSKFKGTKGIRERITALLDRPDEKESGVEAPTRSGVVCDNVGFSYGDKDVLRSVTFELGEGEKAAIVGESGCGKSTLAKILYQYYPDYGGNVSFGGIKLRDISRSSYYRRVGYMPQTTFIFSGSVRDNILMYEDFADAELDRAIDMSGLRSFVDSLTDGVDTVLDEDGGNISGGQRQRIGIARMVIRGYRLIIADEITASLDPATAEQVMSNLLSLDCSVIAITHNTAGIERFDKVFRMNGGKIKEELKWKKQAT